MNSFPKAILHVDGDAFFASCEISLNPKLRGKPVVTGQERGIVSSATYEAKSLGVSRGMPIYQVKKLFPSVIVLSSSYKTYSTFAERMYNIVRRYTPNVEEYSIDECFADVTTQNGTEKSYLALGQALKSDLKRELGITFSIGIAPTKVLAKVASKSRKPDGLTVIPMESIPLFLNNLNIGQVWGIGPSASIYLGRFKIFTAKEFTERPIEWIDEYMDRPQKEIWNELRGRNVFRVHSENREAPKSIQKTKTFSTPTMNKSFLFSELSKNLERACFRARRQGLSPKRVHYFLKTQEFRYHRKEINFDLPLSSPNDILKEIKKTFDLVYKPGFLYRATGITLSGLTDKSHVTSDLFGKSNLIALRGKIFGVLDRINYKYGSNTVFLTSSLKSIGTEGDRRGSKFAPRNHKNHEMLRIPFMGEIAN